MHTVCSTTDLVSGRKCGSL